MSLSTRCKVPSWEQLEAVIGAKRRLRWLSHNYKVGDATHMVTLRVVAIQPAEPDCKFSLAYLRAAADSQDSGVPLEHIEQLVALLATANPPLTFDCNARFERSRSEYTSLMPLPLKSEDWKDMPFDEVTGYRLRKREGDRTAYDVIIEVSESKLHQWLAYKWEAALAPELPATILKAGSDIASKLVFAAARGTQ